MKTRPYHLNKDVWPWLHTTQKGIVITHEVLYRIAIGMTGGPPTSEDIRLVVALLIADRIQEAPRSYAARALNHAFLWVDRDMPHLLAD